MDFSSWSPSHTIFVIVILCGALGTAIWRVAVLFNRVKQVEEQVKNQNTTIETIRQNFTNHLQRHIDSQHQSQSSTDTSGMSESQQ